MIFPTQYGNQLDIQKRRPEYSSLCKMCRSQSSTQVCQRLCKCTHLTREMLLAPQIGFLAFIAIKPNSENIFFQLKCLPWLRGHSWQGMASPGRVRSQESSYWRAGTVSDVCTRRRKRCGDTASRVGKDSHHGRGDGSLHQLAVVSSLGPRGERQALEGMRLEGPGHIAHGAHHGELPGLLGTSGAEGCTGDDWRHDYWYDLCAAVRL